MRPRGRSGVKPWRDRPLAGASAGTRIGPFADSPVAGPPLLDRADADPSADGRAPVPRGCAFAGPMCRAAARLRSRCAARLRVCGADLPRGCAAAEPICRAAARRRDRSAARLRGGGVDAPRGGRAVRRRLVGAGRMAAGVPCRAAVRMEKSRAARRAGGEEMRRRMLPVILIAAIAVILLLLVANTLGRYSGVTVVSQTPAALSDMLRPAYRLSLPQGEGPFPAALLFSGCDGPKDNLETWSAALNAAGWAALVVDSHAPRGLTTLELWRLVCAGQVLTGAERAGDIAVALADARAMPELDGERLAVLGASHGGWAVLDLLALADDGRRPHTLSAWPEAPGSDPLAGVQAALLLYPYCGELARAPRSLWERALPVLMLLVEGDTIARETDCLALAEDAQARGLPVETHLYRGVTHAFDQRDKAALSTLGYDAATTEDALARGLAFLNAAIGR
jgi:dienelactone hydrolase